MMSGPVRGSRIHAAPLSERIRPQATRGAAFAGIEVELPRPSSTGGGPDAMLVVTEPR